MVEIASTLQVTLESLTALVNRFLAHSTMILFSILFAFGGWSQEFTLEIDLLITAKGKKAVDPFVVVYTDDLEPERFESNSKGIVNFVLEPGNTHKIVVSADKCLPKVLLFDTTDQKAKSDKYTCDVELVMLSHTRSLENENGIPVAVIRWSKVKRKWAHDAEYTKEMQRKYREIVTTSQ